MKALALFDKSVARSLVFFFAHRVQPRFARLPSYLPNEIEIPQKCMVICVLNVRVYR